MSVATIRCLRNEMCGEEFLCISRGSQVALDSALTADARSCLMTRSDLITALASRFSHLTAKDAEIAVKEILDAIGNSLVHGNRIEIRGFGSFSVNYRPARKGRNPKSGETVSVPAKYVPHFKAGKEMRERVEESAKPAALLRAA